MTIGERIRYLRKDILHLTQQEFSNSIKISRSNLGNIETNAVSVTPRVLDYISEKYLVNPDWLLNGGTDEEVFVEHSFDMELAQYTQELLDDTDDVIADLIKNFIVVYEKLEPSSKQIIKNTAIETLNRMKKR
ncbi:MAG: helix-turn-helix transcriptional regulator [Lachnospiraceae bacterium]|nr:helix-turn-helix transcriptional regulator [Lachnospiraceae bacterium]MBP3458910.1 helix-turn-helix transcriptional regulator [Lachnospiraceae bacterium]